MIVFTNPGLIDLDAAFTMGVNVKDGTNPIGHFGTGLKFALAVLLREGAHISIWRGAEEIKMTAQAKTIRGRDFDLVAANGDALGFTTSLGKGWMPWMAFRELACNAMDEGGQFYSVGRPPEPEADTTMIVVSGGDIDDAYAERQTILVDGPPIYADAQFEVRPGETNFVYYRGVRIGQLPKPMTHRYNILRGIRLTEDRTFASQWEVTYELGKALLECTDKDIVNRALTCGDGFIEHFLDFPVHIEPKAPFLEAARDLRADLSHGPAANPKAKEMARQRRLSELGPDNAIILPEIDAAKLRKALAMLEAAGYDISNYDIVTVDDLGPDRLGLAKEGHIFIAKRAFERGTREVAATLLEEYAHLLTGHGDETRGLQNWLFDQVLQQIERAHGTAF